jgi:hypothetical protein
VLAGVRLRAGRAGSANGTASTLTEGGDPRAVVDPAPDS